MTWAVGYTKEDAVRVEKENNFEALPAGDYEAFITKVDPNEVAKNTGAKGIAMVYTVREDAHPEYAGRKVFDTIWVVKGDGTPSKAADRAVVLASRLGIPDAQITPDNVIDLFYGKPVKITVTEEEYKGKKQNRVDYMGFAQAELGGRWTEPNPIEAKGSGAASNDPFAGNNGSIDISDDDMPF